MESLYTSLLNQLKNPWQYFCTGITLMLIGYFEINNNIFIISSILISLSLASFIEKIFLYIKNKINIIFYNKELIKKFHNMNQDYKNFLYTLISSGQISFESDFLNSHICNIIKNLCKLEFGYTDRILYNTFVVYDHVYDLFYKYFLDVKNNSKNNEK